MVFFVLKKFRKQCRKGRKCCVSAYSAFSTLFSIIIFLRVFKTLDSRLFGKRVNPTNIRQSIWKNLLASVTIPSLRGSDLRYLLQKEADSNAMKRTFPKK